MKKIILILLIFFAFKSNAQVQQFSTLPTDYRLQAVASSYETPTAYFFNVGVQSKKTTIFFNKNIVYKTDKKGIVLDSLVLIPGNEDSVFDLTDFYKINESTFALYGFVGDMDTLADYLRYFEYKTYFIDTNLNIVYQKSTPNTNNFNLYSRVSPLTKLDGKMFWTLGAKNGQSVYIKIAVFDTLGNYQYEKTIYDSSGQGTSQITTMVKHPDGIHYILGPSGYEYNIMYYDTNLNHVQTIFVPSTTFMGVGGIQIFVNGQSQYLYFNSYQGHAGSPSEQDSICVSLVDSLGHVLKRNCIQPHPLQSTVPLDCIFRGATHYNNLNNIYFGGRIGINKNENMFQITNIDSNLNVRWTKYLGGNTYYGISQFNATSDGGCFILGLFNDTIKKVIAPFVLKIDSTGTVTSLINFSSNINHQVLIYPNPSANFISLVVSSQLNNAQAKIYSINGQLIKSFMVHQGENIQDISNLAIGNYFYEITNNKKEKAVGKFSKN